MRHWQTHLVFPLIAISLIVLSAQAAPPGLASRTLRCALIDVDRSPLGGLVEAELLGRSETTWLERSEIQRLVAERQLQSLLAANAGDDRTALGQLLQADVLVILNTTKDNDRPFAELVVAETRHGLRLISQRLPLEGDLQELAALAAKLVDAGIAKAGEEVTHVFAVPPFVSNDLTYEYDYLKSTYAKLLEQSLLDSENVVVVELEEARAIANELRLASAEDSVQRNVPIYLMGEYRNEVHEDQRRIQIRLQVQQGNTEIDSQQVELTPEAVPEFLRQIATKLAESQGIETPGRSATAEARQLNERAQQFIRLANWQEALGLIEASLLLQPDQPQMHSKAIEVAGHLAGTFDHRKLAELEKAKELSRRSLEHLQTLAAKYSIEACRPHFDLLRFSRKSYLRSHDAGSALPDKLAQLEEKYHREKTELAKALAHRLAENHDWRASAFVLNQFVTSMTPERRYEEITKMILRYQNHPEPERMVRSYSHGGYTVDKLRSLEGRRFLEQLRNHPEANQHVRRTAESLLEAIGTLPEARRIHTSGDPHDETKLTFQPLELIYRNSQGRPVPLKTMDGCLPLEDGRDAFYGSAGVFVLSQDKELRQLWSPPPNTRIQSFSYDGRYLWMAATVHQQAPQIWVFDPIDGQSTQLTAEAGLPLLSPAEIPGAVFISPTVSLATVEQGRAIVVGDIGRTWLADVRFSPQGKHQIKIFHEAKEVIPPGTTEADWRNIHLAFQPVATRTFSGLSESGEPKKVVMICRGSVVYEVTEHALLVDPDDLTIRVAEESWHNRGPGTDPSNMFQGSYYYAGATPPKFDSIGLVRVGMPDFKPEIVVPDIREGYVLINHRQETVNVVGMDWQRGRFGDRELPSFGPVPWLYSNHWGASERTPPIRYERGSFQLKVLADSNQFGSLLCCSEIGGNHGIFQVLFDGSGVSLKEALNGPEGNVERSQPRSVIRPRTSEPKSLWEDQVRPSALAYAPDGSLIVTTNTRASEAVQVWDGHTGQWVADLLEDPVGMTKVVFSHDGKHFATGGARGRVILWDALKLEPVGEFEGQTELIEHLAFSWKDDKVAAASRERTATVWSVPDGKPLYEVEQHNVGIEWLGFSANDSLFLTSSHLVTQAWNAADGSLVGQVESLSDIAGVLKDRSLVASGKDADNTLIKWNSVEASSEELWPRMRGVPVAVSPDGQLLAIYVRERFVDGNRTEVYRVEVWDLPNQQKLASIDGIFGEEYHFTPNQDALVIILHRGGLKRLELKQKNKAAASQAKTPPAARTWTDSTGRHTRQATFVDVRGPLVRLKTSAGETITVPVDRLSPADQTYLREQANHN